MKEKLMTSKITIGILFVLFRTNAWQYVSFVIIAGTKSSFVNQVFSFVTSHKQSIALFSPLGTINIRPVV